MSQPPELFDRAAIYRHRRRASTAPELFLHTAVADEVQERLSEVNRSFTAPAVVTSWPEVWRARLPDATIVQDADVLPLGRGAHDLVVHALALHWANDPVGQLVQARHALRPDGLLLAATLGGRTLSELRSALAQAESSVLGGLSPRVAPMGEIRDLGGLLQRAGLALPVADTTPLRATYETAFHLMRDLRGMGEQNALKDRDRRPAPRALFDEAARIYSESFPAGDGRVAATFEVVWLTGWAPAPGQPQPLRPGSARARLADALDTEERPANDPAAPGHD